MDAALHFRLVFVCFKVSLLLGDALADSPVVKIQALVGGSVVLPCKMRVGEYPAAEWSKKSDIVFLYQSGCETFQEKKPDYRYRTNLFLSEVNKGNFSLMLSDLKPSDAGRYVCKSVENTPPLTVATVELSVGAVSEPKLSVQPSEGGGVTLQCDSGCWSPEPEITIRDPQGKNVSGEITKTLDPQRECSNATRTATVQTAGRFTCSVNQLTINQLKEAEIYVPDDCLETCTPLWKTIILSVVVTFIITIGLGIIFYCWPSCQFVEGHKPLSTQSSNQSSTHSTNELEEISQLRKTIEDKEKIIQDQVKTIQDKVKTIQDKEKIIQDKEKIIQDKEKIIQDQDKTIQDKEKIIQDQDKTIQDKEKIIQDKTIQDKEKIIQDKTIQDKEKIIQDKAIQDKAISRLKDLRPKSVVYDQGPPTAHRSPSRSSPGVSKPNVPTDQPPLAANPEPTKANRTKSFTRSPTKGVKNHLNEPLLPPKSCSPAPAADCSAASAPQEEEEQKERPLRRLSTSSFSHTLRNKNRLSIISNSSNRYEALADQPNDG